MKLPFDEKRLAEIAAAEALIAHNYQLAVRHLGFDSIILEATSSGKVSVHVFTSISSGNFSGRTLADAVANAPDAIAKARANVDAIKRTLANAEAVLATLQAAK